MGDRPGEKATAEPGGRWRGHPRCAHTHATGTHDPTQRSRAFAETAQSKVLHSPIRTLPTRAGAAQKFGGEPIRVGTPEKLLQNPPRPLLPGDNTINQRSLGFSLPATSPNSSVFRRTATLDQISSSRQPPVAQVSVLPPAAFSLVLAVPLFRERGRGLGLR